LSYARLFSCETQ